MDTGENHTQTEPFLTPSDKNEQRKKRLIIIAAAVVGFILLGLLVTGLVFLLSPSLTSTDTVSRLRDIFIILMALESLLIGLVLFILIIQIARLTNLLENEIKPILASTNETISNLRGTSKFLSDNLVEPVIKLNQAIAVFQKFTDIFRISRK